MTSAMCTGLMTVTVKSAVAENTEAKRRDGEISKAFAHLVPGSPESQPHAVFDP